MSDIDRIITELSSVPEPCGNVRMVAISRKIKAASHVFVSGAGRSGMVVNAFANRLTQLGIATSIIGDLTAPHTTKRDIIILNSASGETRKLVDEAEIAQQNNLPIILVTANPSSTLASMADEVVFIKSQTKLSHVDSIQPLGALFEQYSFIWFDSLVLLMMKMFGISEDMMRMRHADIE